MAFHFAVVFVVNSLNVIFLKFLGVEEPFYLLLNCWIKSPPLVEVVRRWELPEHFTHGLFQNWVSIPPDVHRQNKEVDEV